MKLWANKVKVGETIWYEYLWEFKQSTVKEIDTKTYAIPNLIMNNGDRLFVNTYVYTDKSDITVEMIDDILRQGKEKLFELGKKLTLFQTEIDVLTRQLNELENFKNEQICS